MIAPDGFEPFERLISHLLAITADSKQPDDIKGAAQMAYDIVTALREHGKRDVTYALGVLKAGHAISYLVVKKVLTMEQVEGVIAKEVLERCAPAAAGYSGTWVCPKCGQSAMIIGKEKPPFVPCTKCHAIIEDDDGSDAE